MATLCDLSVSEHIDLSLSIDDCRNSAVSPATVQINRQKVAQCERIDNNSDYSTQLVAVLARL